MSFREALKAALPNQVVRFIQTRRSRLGNGIYPYQYYPLHNGKDRYFIGTANDSEEYEGRPVPPLRLRQGYNKTAERFFAGGLKTKKELEAALVGIDRAIPSAPILDFGCGAGRVIRHFTEHAQTHEVWGVDVVAERIQWCIDNLTPPFKFATTGLLPHLPFEDRFFGLVFCFSVFTHTEDLTSAWLTELRRVLQPGGLLCLTIHDEDTISHHVGNAQSIMRSEIIANGLDKMDCTCNAAVIGRRTVSNVYYRRKYFLQKLLAPRFKVLSIIPRGHSGHQTLIIAERKLV